MAHPNDALHGIVHPDINRYLAELAGSRIEPLVEAMEKRAKETKFPIVGRATGRWLSLLTRMIGGKRVFEFGSGFGYSAWFFAEAVGEEGKVVGSDDSPDLIAAHQQMWAHSAFEERVELRLGRGSAVLAEVEGDFDAFLIDSTKSEYLGDFTLALGRLRPGGIILVDNALWGGKVANAANDRDTAAIQAFNHALFRDPRVDVAILPVGDGLAVARKK